MRPNAKITVPTMTMRWPVERLASIFLNWSIKRHVPQTLAAAGLHLHPHDLLIRRYHLVPYLQPKIEGEVGSLCGQCNRVQLLVAVE